MCVSVWLCLSVCLSVRMCMCESVSGGGHYVGQGHSISSLFIYFVSVLGWLVN